MYGVQRKIGKNQVLHSSRIITHYQSFTLFFSDHPSTIKKRFFSVFIVMLLSPLFIYLFSSPDLLKNYTIWYVMGLRTDGFISALVYPLLLTVVLFLGPLSVQLTNGIWKIYSGKMSIRAYMTNC
jgi:hypothetical protein